jgi:polyhydroxyalkanoate synthesis regulator phasin
MSEEQIQNLKDKLSETIDALKAKIEEIDPKDVNDKLEEIKERGKALGETLQEKGKLLKEQGEALIAKYKK